jgi:hypothetical protein
VLHKIRTESRQTGVGTIFLSVMLGYQVVWLGNKLPVAGQHPLMSVVIIFGLTVDLCLLMSGVGVFNGPKCVLTGSLDESRARGLRALVLVVGILGLVFGLFSWGILILITTQRGLFGVITMLYMSFSILALLMAATNYVVIRRLRPGTPPSPGLGSGTRW